MNKVYLLTYTASVYGRSLGTNKIHHIVGVYGNSESALTDMREGVREKAGEMDGDETYRFDGEAESTRSATRRYLDDEGNAYVYDWCITPFEVIGETK